MVVVRLSNDTTEELIRRIDFQSLQESTNPTIGILPLSRLYRSEPPKIGQFLGDDLFELENLESVPLRGL